MEYINTYRQLAIEEMLRTGVPASITLAQGIHETEAGRSELVLKSNNHFGIKCKSNWDGGRVYHDDDAEGECFRSYGSPKDSYADHSDFLKKNQRYSFLFELDPEDYKGWAYGLKKAGYATNIKYSQILIKLIEDYNLQDYTLIALGKLKPSDDFYVTTAPGPAMPVLTSSSPSSVLPPPSSNLPPPSAALPSLSSIYPSGEFQINATRVVVATAGTAWLSIAQKYDIPLARLLDFNDAKEEEILINDQLVFLQRKRKKGEKQEHVVVEGETLYSIAQSEGLRLESLLEYNKMDVSMQPAPGEKLQLQEAATQRPKLLKEWLAQFKSQKASAEPQQVTAPKAAMNSASETKSKASATRHTVQTKETLYSIAKKYNVTVEQIKDWNRMESNSLKIGQELLIYQN